MEDRLGDIMKSAQQYELDRLSEAMEAVLRELEEKIRTCHERVACPKCSAPVGVRCRSMPRGWRPLDGPDRARELKTAHKQRLRAAGISLR